MKWRVSLRVSCLNTVGTQKMTFFSRIRWKWQTMTNATLTKIRGNYCTLIAILHKDRVGVWSQPNREIQKLLKKECFFNPPNLLGTDPTRIDFRLVELNPACSTVF